VAGIVRDYAIGSGRFSVDVEGKGIVVSSNDTDITFTPNELSLLNKGLMYNLHFKQNN
jgi:hypothetical protein